MPLKRVKSGVRYPGIFGVVKKYYSNLLILERDQPEGIYCKGRGWQIAFETKSSAHISVGPKQKPAKEIVVYANSESRAQHAISMVEEKEE